MSYVFAANASASSRLFAARPQRSSEPLPPRWHGAADASRLLSLAGAMLRIAPFRIERWGQTFISAGELRIDLAALPAGRLRIVATHDFRVEDHNPDLDQCRAAVFFARFAHGRWDEPEDHPLECRTLAVLGVLDAEARRLVAP